ncbi:glycoside hydrolase family 78 protein [Pedobacter sp. MC2016-14]|uniref:family 78 glycoside hydrolase catalytic domain n=1 Tax=Pedobacter sp. MC2016-14 TaxID=2897327 RepID=UPI001E58F5EE|nr:family 78 glycoside hydrolase catalytic domain [Pedobacter sp. MC2016-14]MCD0489367.1 glycoside hydrolase family 78 protein [Pedobacter sp. MC2016-14]
MGVFSQNLKVVNLRTEYKINPLGITNSNPSLSWELQSPSRNVLQSAYRILVSDNENKLQKNEGNIWDSGKVKSSSSIQLRYQGKLLLAAKTYYWKVMVWDNKGQVSPWSALQQWQMGLLGLSDWKNAKWIAYEKLADSSIDVLPKDNKKDTYFGSNVLPLLRKDFVVKKPVAKASMFISGLGHFDMSLNGKKQGDHFLDAGWVKYDKEALYVSFDVTKALLKGSNTIGVMLGNGFYYVPPVKGRFRKSKPAFGLPKMICRLLVEYKDGTTENIVSDQSWKTSPGPITFSSIYGGEDYDARLIQKGWDMPSFKDKHWKNVLIVDGPPAIKAQQAEPLKIFENFSAKSVTEISGNNWVYDLGQNASGIISLKVKGNKGDTIRVYPGELLKDGKVTQKSTGGPFYFEYVLNGAGIETWQPQFTYYGFRYLELRGGRPSGKQGTGRLPEILELKGLHTRNAAARAGEFSSSNQLFNKTDQLIDWAIKSNMASTFTDCPHREKLGWLEQSHLMISSVMYSYDVATLANKVVGDVMTSQLDNGLIPEIAPEYIHFTWGGDMFRDSPEWGSTGIILPWYLYRWYGDTGVLKNAYPTMQRYIAYLQKKAENNILKQGLGDWYDIGPERPGVSQQTPMGVTGTATYYYNLCILEKIANVLGKKADAEQWAKLASSVKQSFNNTFFNRETAQYATGSQTANAMAIYMQLVEPEYKDRVFANLIKDIRDRKNALTAGDIGYRYVLRVLEAEHRSDIIFDMNSRSDVPGYGYQLAHGATALTESWAAISEVSNNHFMLGHIMEWFYSGIGGIRQEDNSVAFNKIRIYPEAVGDLITATTSYHSSYGLIKTSWRKTAATFELDVTIPANTTAMIYLPALSGKRISEANKELDNVPEVKMMGFEKGRAILKVGSGVYKFKVQDYL